MLHDEDIREPLFMFLEETSGKVRILEEKQTGRARADVVMVTERYLYGIEIKSDADSYVRLSRQVKYYDQYYDRNIVVVGSTHAAHISEHVPEWWGIISAEIIEGKMDFYILRKPADNPKVQDTKKITILWRPELNRILKNNCLPAYKNRSKAFVQKKLLDSVPGELLWPQVMNELFERDYNTIADEIEQYRHSS
ncbi:MAG: sce7726 family protein [Blautia sp.]|nr:sce7726 family protein [Blautia sp.]